MEYIFGNRLYNGEYVEYMKTIGNSYSNFEEGKFQACDISIPGTVIKHNFRVLRKFRTQTDLMGNLCTWYYIDNHSVDIDRTPGLNIKLNSHDKQLEEQSEVIDDILIELLKDTEE